MLDPNEYVEEFVYNYGEDVPRAGPPVVGTARAIRRRRALFRASHAQANRHGLARDHRAQSRRRGAGPRACPGRADFRDPAPVPAARTPFPEETLRFRESLGLTPETLLIGTFGHQRETKRLAVVLRAFQRAIRRRCPSPGLGRVRLRHVRKRDRSPAPASRRHSNRVPARTRAVALRRGHGSLHQPALSLGGGDLRHRGAHDGHRQAGDLHGQRGAGPNSRPTLACGWMWDPTKNRCWPATSRGWRETARPGSKSAGAPPRTSRSVTLRKKSPGNTGTSSISPRPLVKTERLGLGSHPQHRRRGFPRRQADQMRLQHDQRLPHLFRLGGCGEQTPQKRNTGKPRDPGAALADAVCINPAITADSPSTSRVMP